MISKEESDRNRPSYEFLLKKIKRGSVYEGGSDIEYARDMARNYGYNLMELSEAMGEGIRAVPESEKIF